MPRRKKTGGDRPVESTFYDTAKEAYQVKPKFSIDNFRLYFNSPTMRAWVNEPTKTVVVAVRGMNVLEWRDISASSSLPFNRLTTTDRYKLDKEHLEAIMAVLPPNEWEYYLSGHSLGGAIINQFKRDFPQLKAAVEYNGAFSPWDLIQQDNENIKRIYASTDPIFQYGGKFFRNSVVVPIVNKSPLESHKIETIGRAVYGRGKPSKKLRGGARRFIFSIHELPDHTWFVREDNSGAVIARLATREEAEAILQLLNDKAIAEEKAEERKRIGDVSGGSY